MDCIGTLLISTMSKSGSAKSIILPISETQAEEYRRPTSETAAGRQSEVALSTWILNPHIDYLSSQKPAARGAIKLLYKVICKAEAERLTELVASDMQEINVVHEALLECIECLKQSTQILPPEQRVFNDWQVGLLDRYSLT
jgi:ubiquitin-protein ligase E3 D